MTGRQSSSDRVAKRSAVSAVPFALIAVIIVAFSDGLKIAALFAVSIACGVLPAFTLIKAVDMVWRRVRYGERLGLVFLAFVLCLVLSVGGLLAAVPERARAPVLVLNSLILGNCMIWRAYAAWRSRGV